MLVRPGKSPVFATPGSPIILILKAAKSRQGCLVSLFSFHTNSYTEAPYIFLEMILFTLIPSSFTSCGAGHDPSSFNKVPQHSGKQNKINSSTLPLNKFSQDGLLSKSEQSFSAMHNTSAVHAHSQNRPYANT